MEKLENFQNNNRKIMIFILIIFIILFILATFLFISSKNKEKIKTDNKLQNQERYIKIEDANLSSSNADINILVKYSLGLYAKAIDIVRYSYDELVIQKDDEIYKFYRIGD